MMTRKEKVQSHFRVLRDYHDLKHLYAVQDYYLERHLKQKESWGGKGCHEGNGIKKAETR